MSYAERTLIHPPATRQTTRWLLLVALALASVVALVALPLDRAVWVPIVLAVAALVALAPVVLLYILPFAVAFGSLVSLSLGHINAGPTDLLAGAFVLYWLLSLGMVVLREASPRQLLTQAAKRLRDAAFFRREPQRLAVFAALLAYLAVIALSLAVATSRTETLKEVLKWAEVTVVAAMALWLLRSARQAHILAWAMIAASLLEALQGYGQWVIASGDLGPGGASVRVFGTFAQPNPYGGFLNLALPLALALVLFGDDARERWVAGAAAVLLLGAQGLADSRGALLGLGAALVVMLIVFWRKLRLASLAALGAAILLAVAWFVGVFPASLRSRVLNQLTFSQASLCNGVNNANFSTMERLAHWAAGLEMFAAHPLLGVGAGNYNAAYAHYAVAACWPEPLGHAHNYYINAAAETGILGLLAFLAVAAAALYAGWRACRVARPSKSVPEAQPAAAATVASAATESVRLRRALALGFLGVIVALLVHNLTDDLFVHAMELEFALCLGALVRLGALATSNR